MINTRIAVNSARYRPRLLVIAALSSFISATWAAAEPDATNPWYWNRNYTIPIVILTYATFFLIFILKGILQWRFELQVPLPIVYGCLGLAWCTQLVAIVLEHLARNTYSSGWVAINLFSGISFAALTIYLVLPVLPEIWRILLIIMLPERLRASNPPDTSAAKPLLPSYAPHPIENQAWVDEPIIGHEDSVLFDSTTVRQGSDGAKETRKNGYTLLPGDDLERGGL